MLSLLLTLALCQAPAHPPRILPMPQAPAKALPTPVRTSGQCASVNHFRGTPKMVVRHRARLFGGRCR
jgi:hypothetical protein